MTWFVSQLENWFKFEKPKKQEINRILRKITICTVAKIHFVYSHRDPEIRIGILEDPQSDYEPE